MSSKQHFTDEQAKAVGGWGLEISWSKFNLKQFRRGKYIKDDNYQILNSMTINYLNSLINN